MDDQPLAAGVSDVHEGRGAETVLASPNSHQHVGFLDGLRTIAAFWVLVAHCLIWGGYNGWWPNQLVAVQVFMFLSGYLMMFQTNRREVREPMTQPRSWWRFYLRRFFRISPAYYLALALAALGSVWFKGGYTHLMDCCRPVFRGSPYDPRLVTFGPTNIAVHVTYLFGLLPRYGDATLLPDWSLSLEMQFYAVFPALFLAFKRWGAMRVSIGALALALPFWLLLRHAYSLPSLLPLQLPYFLAGALVFVSTSERRIAPLLLAMAIGSFEIHALGAMAVIVPSVALLTHLLVTHDGAWVRWTRRALDNRLTRVGANISYSVYLTHGFFLASAGLFIDRIERAARVPFLLSFVVVTTVVVSLLIYRVVELPGIALGRRLEGQRAASV